MEINSDKIELVKRKEKAFFFNNVFLEHLIEQSEKSEQSIKIEGAPSTPPRPFS